MRKRIVERTLMSGKKQYRVEVAKTIMGVVLFWTLDARHDPLYPDRDTAAVFSTAKRTGGDMEKVIQTSARMSQASGI